MRYFFTLCGFVFLLMGLLFLTATFKISAFPVATFTPTASPSPKPLLPTWTSTPRPTFTPIPPTPQSNQLLKAQIVFVRDQNIYLWEDNSANIRLITSKGDNYEPDIHDSWVVFASARDNQMLDIYIINVERGTEKRITSDASWDRHPSFSPDGNRIAFTSFRKGNWEIYIINRDGSGLYQVTHMPDSNEYAPTWGPDGLSLTYQSNVSGEYEIYTYNLKNGHLQQITWDATVCRVGAFWSPDGQTIGFYHCQEPFYWMTIDLTSGIITERGPGIINDWLDEHHILFHRPDASGQQSVYTFDTVTGEQRLIITDASWSAVYVP